MKISNKNMTIKGFSNFLNFILNPDTKCSKKYKNQRSTLYLCTVTKKGYTGCIFYGTYCFGEGTTLCAGGTTLAMKLKR